MCTTKPYISQMHWFKDLYTLKNKKVTIINGVFRCEYFAGTRIRTLDLRPSCFSFVASTSIQVFGLLLIPKREGPFKLPVPWRAAFQRSLIITITDVLNQNCQRWAFKFNVFALVNIISGHKVAFSVPRVKFWIQSLKCVATFRFEAISIQMEKIQPSFRNI